MVKLQLPRRYRSGFTMIELLISIGIFTIITGLVIVNFRSGQYRDELNGAAGIAQAALREMQTAASSGAVTPSSCPGQTTPGVPASGYGVHFEPPNTVILFADCETTAPKTYAYPPISDPNFILVREVAFSPNVAIDSLLPGNPLDVVFDPFVETVKINAGSADATITFQHLKSVLVPLTVRLNAATGQVFIQ